MRTLLALALVLSPLCVSVAEAACNVTRAEEVGILCADERTAVPALSSANCEAYEAALLAVLVCANGQEPDCVAGYEAQCDLDLATTQATCSDFTCPLLSDNNGAAGGGAGASGSLVAALLLCVATLQINVY